MATLRAPLEPNHPPRTQWASIQWLLDVFGRSATKTKFWVVSSLRPFSAERKQQRYMFLCLSEDCGCSSSFNPSTFPCQALSPVAWLEMIAQWSAITFQAAALCKNRQNPPWCGWCLVCASVSRQGQSRASCTCTSRDLISYRLFDAFRIIKSKTI